MNLSYFNQQAMRAGKPVVVDFWAEWCVPCRLTKPILEKLAKEYAGRIDFLPVNVDDSRELLERFRVVGIPTVLALRDGEVVSRVTGAQNEAGYRLLFEGLTQGGEVKLPMSSFDRMLRLGAGMLFAILGLSTGSWLALAIGGLIAFLGMYDRCHAWKALSRCFSASARKR
jgi:thioredoxin 1